MSGAWRPVIGTVRPAVRDLALLRSQERSFLESERTFDDAARFVASLSASGAGEPAVYAHQQVYLDYRGSVVAKILALRTLGALSPGIRTDFVWIDTDRCGSDKLSLRLYLESRRGAVPVRLAPAGCEDRETRFVHTDAVRLRQGADHVAGVVQSTPRVGSLRLSRWNQLRPLVEAGGTLADVSRRLTDAMLGRVLGFVPRPVLVSDLAASGDLNRALSTILNRLPEFVATYNARIETLRARDIDPRVKPLADDYLPLFITTPGDQRRTRLRLVRDGRVHLACAVDRAGRSWCYELGRRELSLEGLFGHVDFAPDVTLPIQLNDRYSGVVCGKSSALYLLVFNEVMRKVLDMKPVPILVPPSWDVFPGAYDSLLAAYLDGRRV